MNAPPKPPARNEDWTDDREAGGRIKEKISRRNANNRISTRRKRKCRGVVYCFFVMGSSTADRDVHSVETSLQECSNRTLRCGTLYERWPGDHTPLIITRQRIIYKNMCTPKREEELKSSIRSAR